MSTEIMPNAGTELMSEDFTFLEGMAGEGFQEMGAGATSTAYLGLVQPDSTAAQDGDEPGTWRNSATGQNYGADVKVVVLAFKTIWNERESDPPFRTVGRYPVGGLDVEIRQPPKGKKGYPKMINPESGNEVQELFVYALVLPEHPEAGIIYFQPTVGSMRTCKSWNTSMFNIRLPNGAQAPIFASTWILSAGLVSNPQQPSKQIAKFLKATKDTILTQELFMDLVKGNLDVVKQEMVLITSGVSPDSDEE